MLHGSENKSNKFYMGVKKKKKKKKNSDKLYLSIKKNNSNKFYMEVKTKATNFTWV